jgi:dipeptidyl aminopeptidase/acylaminoacyl peptidase
MYETLYIINQSNQTTPMKKLLHLLLFAAFALANCSAPREEPPKVYTISQFMDIVQINGGSFSPDEAKIIINSKESGIFNVYEIDIATGEQKQLTRSTDNAIFSQSYFPNDNRIIYSSDKGGNEIDHLFVLSPDGSATDIISDSTAKASFGGWSYDKKQMYIASNSRDKRFFDLYKAQLDNVGGEQGTLVTSLMYKNEQGLDPASISNSGRYIALVKTITTSNNDMYLLDTESGATKHLSLHEGNINYAPQYFSLDDKILYYLTDEGSEYTYLASYEIETGKTAKVEEAPWDIMYAYQSRNGKYRVVAINNDARTEIKIYDQTNGNKLIQPKNLPEGDITGVNISDSEKLMSFYVSSSKSPANFFVYNFETGEVKQLTQTMTKDINPNDLVAGEVIRYKSFDGLEIPALLYKPKGLKEGEKVPALLWIHGGPGGQTRLNYSPTIQHLVNHGYVILAVNNRGSSGYGKTFFAADDRKHGDVDLRDCIESKKYLATLPYVGRFGEDRYCRRKLRRLHGDGRACLCSGRV